MNLKYGTKQSILTMSILAIVAVMAATSTLTQQNVKASNFFQDLGESIDDASDDYKEGDRDGENAGEDDYPNFNSTCPPHDGLAYCAGYTLGYGRGFNAAKIVNN